MEHGHHLNTLPIEPFSPNFRYTFTRLEKPLGGNVAESDHDAGVEKSKLSMKISFTGKHLLRLGIAISRGAALDDVRNIYILSRNMHRLEDISKQLARTSHKGNALGILLRSGPFSNEDKSGLGVSRTENGTGSLFMKGTLGAFRHFAFRSFP